MLIVAPFTLALSVLPVELYQRSPFEGVEGSEATEPILIPAAAAPGAKVCLVFAGNVSAPVNVGVAIVGEVSKTACPVPVLAEIVVPFI